MRIEIDSDTCAGHGVCESFAPDHFEVDDDGAVRLLSANVGQADPANLRAAVAGCPTRALRLIDG